MKNITKSEKDFFYSRSDLLHEGNRHSIFEEQYSNFLEHGTRAFAFWKGRVALYAILKSIGIGPDDEVIVPGFTCVVVPNAIRLAGATPVYVDISPHSYNIDIDKIDRAITPKTKAILVQHTFGIPAQIEEAVSLGNQYGIPVIEDCAHTLGTRVNGRHAGTQGLAGFFSSQWSKPYTTGLGGVAITCNEELARKLGQIQAGFRQPPLASQARLLVQYIAYQLFFSPRLFWQAQNILRTLSRLGIGVGSSNERELQGVLPKDHEWVMASFQHRFGQGQLLGAIQKLESRRKLAGFFDQGLSKAGWQVLQRSNETTLLRYPVRVSNKSVLLERAQVAGIELGSWFETPLHPVPLEKHAVFGYALGQCPVSEQAAQQTVNLPLHNRVKPADAERILDFFVKNALPAKS